MEAENEFEENLRRAFPNRTLTMHRLTIPQIRQQIEKVCGYSEPLKPLKYYIDKIINLHDENAEWTAKALQAHVFFFTGKKENIQSIRNILAEKTKLGAMRRLEPGIYTKAEK